MKDTTSTFQFHLIRKIREKLREPDSWFTVAY